MAAAAHHHHHLKLVFDPNQRRVLFAETNGEAIEFIHSLLVSLPFDGATGRACIANVYDSVDKLRAFAAAANISRPPSSTVQRQEEEEEEEEEERFFVCSGGSGASCGDYVTDKSGARCPSCGGEMAVEVPRGFPGASCSDAYAAGTGNGVEGASQLTCMLMDDLNIMPAGAGLGLRMATTFMMGFVAPGRLQETEVCLGYTEAMEILETSLQSNTVLTDVFLCKKKTRRFGKSPQ